MMAAAIALSVFTAGPANANCTGNCTDPSDPYDLTVWDAILYGCGYCGLQSGHAGTARVGPLAFDADSPGAGLIQMGGTASVLPVYGIADNGSTYTISMASSFGETNGKKQIFNLWTVEVVDKQTATVLSISNELTVLSSAAQVEGRFQVSDSHPNMFSIAPSTYEFVYSNGAVITFEQNFDPANPLDGAVQIQPASMYPGEYTNANIQIKMFVPAPG